ncbi:CPBP family intramembrane metalloprotease [Polaribacter batillariae]|uniref:CPBP family intramembrane metalloprotease n=1 Tax=Polaribacter batillariae TaxID=2808900 RepID=A0ABX7SY09_9FLAO|nr:CPBP family intramembrane glutamic endopeptidase [Polaribacter batillariae]QTD38193.1 CPBP family intramembrane metalloprotease [Polaribacter batillariae]
MNSKPLKRNTIGRIFLFIIAYLFIVGIFQLTGAKLAGVDYTNLDYKQTSIQQLTTSFFDLVGTFLVIWLFMKFVDKEKFIELGFQTKNRFKDFFYGIIIGFIIMVLGYLLLIYFKEIFFVKINFDIKELLISICLFTIVAIVEETLFRGYVLKNLMSSFHKYIALILSSILFSLAHSFNPNVDLFSLFVLFLAGIVLGLSYIYTKNLWFPIAMHLSWNLFQTLLGFNVSGQDSYSIIEFKINEGNLVNGGAFGFEGSYLSIIAEIITIIGIGYYYNRKRIYNKI